MQNGIKLFTSTWLFSSYETYIAFSPPIDYMHLLISNMYNNATDKIDCITTSKQNVLQTMTK